MDSKTSDQLLNALQKLKADSDKLQQKHEQKLWKKINYPCSLSEALSGLTKAELDNIRRNLELKGLSSFNKPQLVEKLVELLPHHLTQTFFLLDQERYQVLREIKKKGYVKGSYASVLSKPV